MTAIICENRAFPKTQKKIQFSILDNFVQGCVKIKSSSFFMGLLTPNYCTDKLKLVPSSLATFPDMS